MWGAGIGCSLAIGLAGCGGPAAHRDQLAAQGLIQEDAPVKAAANLDIAAPPARIFALLTNVGGWPAWQADIIKATISGIPAIGTPFVWSTGGMDIHSTIRLLDRDRELCWTGRMLHIQAIHCWTLTVLPGGIVRVATRESMDGWLISRMYSSADLLESDRHWLALLKRAAEY